MVSVATVVNGSTVGPDGVAVGVMGVSVLSPPSQPYTERNEARAKMAITNQTQFIHKHLK